MLSPNALRHGLELFRTAWPHRFADQGASERLFALYAKGCADLTDAEWLEAVGGALKASDHLPLPAELNRWVHPPRDPEDDYQPIMRSLPAGYLAPPVEMYQPGVQEHPAWSSVKCPNCQGHGNKGSCPTCNGVGIVCPACRGAGWVVNDAPPQRSIEPRPCPVCRNDTAQGQLMARARLGRPPRTSGPPADIVGEVGRTPEEWAAVWAERHGAIRAMSAAIAERMRAPSRAGRPAPQPKRPALTDTYPERGTADELLLDVAGSMRAGRDEWSQR